MSITLPHRILAIDPATTKSGWAVLDVICLDPLQIKIIDYGTLDGAQLFRQKKEMAAIFSKQYCVLDALYDVYVELLLRFRPDKVVSESAFGYTHMSAFLALTLAINTLRRAVHFVLGTDVVTVPPTITKSAFTGKGNADKDAMRAAYEINDYLIKLKRNEPLTEHEIDGIAHGVAYVFRDILQTIIQISAKDKKRALLEKRKSKLES